MPRVWIWCAGIVTIVGVAALLQWQKHLREQPALYEPAVKRVEAAPLCPWREPEEGLRHFFPDGTHYVAQKLILSGLRLELTERLGRAPEPEENTLTLHRIFREAEEIGCVLTRRVKGEHGAIELVLATSRDGEVRGLRLQRMREPESVAKELQNAAWLDLFRGRKHDRGWDLDDLTYVPEEARASAHAVREGVRSLLVLQAVGERSLVEQPDHHH